MSFRSIDDRRARGAADMYATNPPVFCAVFVLVIAFGIRWATERPASLLDSVWGIVLAAVMGMATFGGYAVSRGVGVGPLAAGCSSFTFLPAVTAAAFMTRDSMRFASFHRGLIVLAAIQVLIVVVTLAEALLHKPAPPPG